MRTSEGLWDHERRWVTSPEAFAHFALTPKRVVVDFEAITPQGRAAPLAASFLTSKSQDDIIGEGRAKPAPACA